MNLRLTFCLLLFLGELVRVDSHDFINPKSRIKVQNVQEKNIHAKHFQDTPQISVTPTSLAHSGDVVTVTWTGINEPSSDDWIAAYSPANVDRTKTAPIKFRWANTSSTHLTTGSGTLQFQLVNGRADYSFTFLRNGTVYPISLVTSQVVEFQNYNEPLQGRLSFTAELDEMRVMWSTLSSTKPQVRWGESSGNYQWINNGDSYTYGVEELCGEPATTYGWREPGLIHEAIMTNLQRGKQYFYIYGDEQYGWSQESSFFATLGAEPTEKVRFYAFGDLGQAPQDSSEDPKWYQPHSLNVTSTMIQDFNKHKNDTHLILHFGDISYAVGYAAEWDEFGEQIKPLASQLAYQASPGNHETDWVGTDSIFIGTDSGGECGLPFYARFPIPTTSASPKTHWYSFNTGPLHVVMMSTEHNFTLGSPQYDFIQNDLASVDHQATPWIVLTGHRPMYIDSTNNVGNGSDAYVAQLLREYIEPLMFKHQVDVGFWGHHHSYQRTCFVQNTTCLARPTTTTTTETNTTTSWFYSTPFVAPIHFVVGTAGATSSTNLQQTAPEYTEYINDSEHGFALVEVEAARSFHLSFITETGALRDDFWIYK